MRRWARVFVAALAVWASGPAARAAEAPRSAWWNRANVGLLPAFAPPDVDEDHLLVEGVTDAEDGWVAVAAVDFVLDAPGGETTLTLVAGDIRPESVPPVACALNAGFTPVAGGPWSDVPTYSCERGVPGEAATGDRFIFRNVQTLGPADEVRLLIVPGGIGRFVFDVPAADALHVTPAPSSGGREAVPDLTPVDGGGNATSPLPDLPLSDVPVPDAVAPASQGAPVVSDRSIASTAPPFELPAGDFGTRLATAAVLALLLGAFIVLQRGGSARLRPAQVTWRRPPSP